MVFGNSVQQNTVVKNFGTVEMKLQFKENMIVCLFRVNIIIHFHLKTDCTIVGTLTIDHITRKGNTKVRAKFIIWYCYHVNGG